MKGSAVVTVDLPSGDPLQIFAEQYQHSLLGQGFGLVFWVEEESSAEEINIINHRYDLGLGQWPALGAWTPTTVGSSLRLFIPNAIGVTEHAQALMTMPTIQVYGRSFTEMATYANLDEELYAAN